MKVQKIKIEGFKSIYDPIEINFQEVSGFWKISGSVGAGKTTIGEAIIYGLFGTVNGKNNADLISWGRKKGLVEIWCTSKNNDIYIRREMKTYGQSPIYVEVNGEELVFTNKRDAQSQLEQEYYDTSKVTLELLCIISFNNFKSLATLNSGDTKKFLDQVLGFCTLTGYAEECKSLKTNNLQNIHHTNNLISRLESQINKLEELSNIELIDGNIQETKNIIGKLTTDLQDIQKSLNIWNREHHTIKNEYVKKQASVLTLGKNKKKEIDFIEKGTCPTCGAPIDQSQLPIKKKERDVLLEQYNSISAKINELDIEMANYSEHIQEEQIDPLNIEISKYKKLLTRLEEQTKRIAVNKNEIESLNIEIEKCQHELNIYQKEDAEWQQLYDILSSQIRSKILNSFIPSLNNNILHYAQRLHLPYIVQFDSNFKCNINLCGIDQAIPVSSLSTGQLKTVDMVIILGILGTVIGSNGINILFLDELFSNLDTSLRNEMCQLLRESLKPDNTIFIISHTDLDDKYFDGNIHMKLELKDQYEKHSVCKIEKFDKTY